MITGKHGETRYPNAPRIDTIEAGDSFEDFVCDKLAEMGRAHTRRSSYCQGDVIPQARRYNHRTDGGARRGKARHGKAGQGRGNRYRKTKPVL